MEHEFDSMMGFDKLGLYYDVHTAGFDGENFTYSVYFADAPDDSKLEKTRQVVSEFLQSFDEETFPGYVDVTNEGDKLSVYLDLGNTTPGNENISIQGILKALNNVSGIKQVIVNEDCEGFDF